MPSCGCARTPFGGPANRGFGLLAANGEFHAHGRVLSRAQQEIHDVLVEEALFETVTV